MYSGIAHQRLHNQRLAQTTFEAPEDVVSWLGAVQSQDYGGAKWGISQRAIGLSDSVIDQAFADGKILRTHVMRPTWHFVTPADIRWMLELTAPRVNALNAYMYRQLELDETLFQRSNDAISKALQGGKHLTRAELATALEKIGIVASGMRLGYIVHRAELDAVVCSGPRKGKQFTYALLDERAQNARRLERDEALAELVKRYFVSHGPATIHDFAWWSGLTVNDTKVGIEMVKAYLNHEVINEETYWFASSMQYASSRDEITVYLLPNYDEYTVAYSDRNRGTIYGVPPHKGSDPRDQFIFSHALVIDGRVAGSWKRTFRKGTAVIDLAPFEPLSKAEKRALAVAARRYSEFLKTPVVLSSNMNA